jgi:hypothetical protein
MMPRDNGEVENAVRRESGSGSGPASDRVEVYLAPARGAYLPGLLGRLAHGFGLDVFGGSQLGRQAALALRFSAFLLLVIVCFDLVAWTLLFNSIFHSSGDILDHDNWTWFALLCGVLFASAIFIYERQFFTADTSDLLGSPARFLAVSVAVGIRIAILIAAALITAQPVELLVFREVLRQRTHEEAVRQEVVASVKKLDDLQGKLKDLALLPAQLELKMQGTKELAERDAGRGTVKRESDHLVTLQKEQGRILRSLGTLAGTADPTSLTILTNLQASADKIDREINKQHRAVDAARRNLEQAESTYQDAADKLYGRELGKQTGIEQQQDMVHGYLDRVRKVGMKQPVTLELPRTDPRIPRDQLMYSYTFQGSNFFDQLRILDDRIQGRQARWPAGEPEKDRTDFSQKYALGHLAPNEEEAVVSGARRCSLRPGSAEPTAGLGPEVDQRIAEACLFRRSYAVVYAIGMVIPLLVFAVKFLMPRELKHYFSVRQQAWAGHPEALACQRGEEKRRRAKEEARARRREKREEARARRRRSMVRRREPANA